MNAQPKKWRKSEWVILLAPLLVMAAWWGATKRDELVHRYLPRRLKGHLPEVSSLRFSPDGQFLAVTSKDINPPSPAHELCLWNARKGRLLWRQRHNPPIGLHQFSPDGKYLAVAGLAAPPIPDPGGSKANSAVQIYDVQTGQLIRRIPRHNTRGFRFMKDNQHLLVDGQPMRLWNYRTGLPMREIRIDAQESLYSLFDLSLDEKLLAVIRVPKTSRDSKLSDSTGAIKVLEMESGKLLSSLSLKSPWRIEFSHDNQQLHIERLLDGKDQLLVWDWKNKRLDLAVKHGEPYAVCPFPDGKRRIVSEIYWAGVGHEGFRGWRIYCEDIKTGRIEWSQAAKGPVKYFQFSPDSKLVFYADAYKRVIIRSMKDGNLVHEYSYSRAFMLSPDGQKIALGSGDTVYIHDISRLKP